MESIKKKITIEEQISHMKNNNIKFEICKEDEANHFLKEHNYYFKIKSYSKNFSKYTQGENKGKYINLDFAYLKELASIDMRLRQIILRMCLNLEHSLRCFIVLTSTMNKYDNGYNVAQSFLRNHSKTKTEIERAKDSCITCSLYNKYNSDFSVWSLVELLTFSGITKFILYYFDYSYFRPRGYNTNQLINFFDFNVRHLRNAAAHNNCLINDLREYDKRGINNFSVDGKIRKYLEDNIKIIKSKERNKYLKVPVLQDLASLIIMYDEYVTSEKVKANDYRELNSLFKERITKNKEYFNREQNLTGAYNFINKIIDFVNTK